MLVPLLVLSEVLLPLVVLPLVRLDPLVVDRLVVDPPPLDPLVVDPLVLASVVLPLVALPLELAPVVPPLELNPLVVDTLLVPLLELLPPPLVLLLPEVAVPKEDVLGPDVTELTLVDKLDWLETEADVTVDVDGCPVTERVEVVVEVAVKTLVVELAVLAVAVKQEQALLTIWPSY